MSFLKAFIIIFIIPFYSFANCLKDVIEKSQPQSLSSLKATFKLKCSQRQVAIMKNVITQIKILNPVSVENTESFLDQRILKSLVVNKNQCQRTSEVNLGACLLNFLESDVGREIEIGLTPIHKGNTTKSHKAIGKISSHSGNCTYTAISKNHILTSLHCFIPKFIPSEHFDRSFDDTISRIGSIELNGHDGSHYLGTIDRYILFSSLENFNDVTDDLIVLEFKSQVARNYLKVGSIEELQKYKSFKFAGYPGKYQFSPIPLYEREADSISVDEESILKMVTISFKGDSGSALRGVYRGQEYILGTIFGKLTSAGNGTVFSYIDKDRATKINQFVSGTLPLDWHPWLEIYQR